MAIDELRRNVEKNKPLGKTTEELAPRFTSAFQSLLTKAITDIESGRLSIDNFTELQRVYMMWKEVVDYQGIIDGQSNAQGVLPAITTRGTVALDKAGLTEDTSNLEDMSDEDMTKVIMGMMQASNLDNVDEMKGLQLNEH